MDVGNDLALLVSGDVGDLVRDIHAPVDAFGGAGRGIAATRINQHADPAGCVFLVAGIVREYSELGPRRISRQTEPLPWGKRWRT